MAMVGEPNWRLWGIFTGRWHFGQITKMRATFALPPMSEQQVSDVLKGLHDGFEYQASPPSGSFKRVLILT
jgi:hypothetical protein